MKRILIVANTYYQLILAMQMKQTLFRKDYVSLMLSNHNKNADRVFSKLKEIKFFDETVYVESKGILQNRSLIKKAKEVFQLSFAKKNDYSFYLRDLLDLRYDEYISYNLEVDNYGIFATLSEFNNSLKYSSYEEGVLSYESFYYDSIKFKLIRELRRLFRKPTIFDNYNTFYCMYPQLYNGNLSTVCIPPISIEDRYLKKALSDIFEVKNNTDYTKIRCIYFESIYETEGRPIGEKEILLEIVNRIGKDLIVIKRHPRSTVDTFENLGIQVDSNSSVPFEVIQIVCDLSKCVLVSATSGSVFSVNAILTNPLKSILFYPMTSYKSDDQLREFIPHIDKVIKKLKETGKFDYIKVVHDIKELISEIVG